MKKNIVIATMICALFFGFSFSDDVKAETADFTWIHAFDDVPGNAWHAKYVNAVCAYGLFKGVDKTHFQPNAAIKRADFITVLGRMQEKSGAAIPDASSSFHDTAKNSYYSKYVSWAIDAGIIKGYGNGKFKPNAPISKEEMAVIFYRYIQYTEPNITAESKAIFEFNDFGDISGWAFQAIAYLQGYSVITGDDTFCFYPQKSLTRAEAATVFVKLHNLIFEDKGAIFLGLE